MSCLGRLGDPWSRTKTRMGISMDAVTAWEPPGITAKALQINTPAVLPTGGKVVRTATAMGTEVKMEGGK